MIICRNTYGEDILHYNPLTCFGLYHYKTNEDSEATPMSKTKFEGDTYIETEESSGNDAGETYGIEEKVEVTSTYVVSGEDQQRE